MVIIMNDFSSFLLKKYFTISHSFDYMYLFVVTIHIYSQISTTLENLQESSRIPQSIRVIISWLH